MGVKKYESRGRPFWMVDETLLMPDGREHRLRKRRIPTREQALAFVTKARADAFEGRYFDRIKRPSLTVIEAWDAYKPIGQRHDAWASEQGRAAHIIRHLGKECVVNLAVKHVDEYRTRRLAEITKRGGPPSPATLDREVELLKRMLNYAVKCGRLQSNPLADVQLLREPNVRRSVVDHDAFASLFEAADQHLKPILALAYDTGMRKREVLDLRWEQVDLRQGVIRLAPQDTKGGESRPVYLSPRVLEALRETPRRIDVPWVFVNPKTGKPWQDIRKAFRQACKEAKLEGAWFHDLRRSFVTNARRAGVPESVVMRMSGHRTRAVFERYNIVSEDDLQQAVELMEQRRLRQETVKVSDLAVGAKKPLQ